MEHQNSWSQSCLKKKDTWPILLQTSWHTAGSSGFYAKTLEHINCIIATRPQQLNIACNSTLGTWLHGTAGHMPLYPFKQASSVGIKAGASTPIHLQVIGFKEKEFQCSNVTSLHRRCREIGHGQAYDLCWGRWPCQMCAMVFFLKKCAPCST